MPTLIGTPSRHATPDYAFSVANVVPSMLARGAAGATASAPAHSAFNPVYRADLIESVTVTVQQIEQALHSYSVPRVSLADLVFMEEPDSDRAYQDAFEWQPVAVRIVEDRETGYAGDTDVWR